ncbi:AMP-binding protein [Parapusillimonas sp. JC17]|uniref:AMP-binding protein n=1 Tax=Parapusillimonas sp. JC17 TaxID=3445768 RepID=UPI003FA124C7
MIAMKEQGGSTAGTAALAVPDKLDSAWTVPGILKDSVRRYGSRPSLEVVGGVSETYDQTWENVSYLARCLFQQGVRPQQRVLIMLANTHLAVHGWLAVNLINAVDVSINTGYKGQSLEHAANLSAAQILMTTSDHLPVILRSQSRLAHLRTIVLMDDADQADWPTDAPFSILRFRDLEAAPPDCLAAQAAMPWDIGSVIYTSGTSGPAKGVMMPHGQIALLSRLSAAKTSLQADDIFFSFYPMYHMAGKFMSVLATLSVGGRIVLDTGFTPGEWLNRIRAYGATITAAHGPMLEMVYAQPPSDSDKDHRLRLIRTAPFPKRIAAAFEARFGVRGQEVWGMTETGVACWVDPNEPLRVGCCGRVDESWFDFAVVDPATDMKLPAGTVGEFLLRPKVPWTMMQGYLGMPEKTLEAWRNFWFHTGDCGYVDADGYVYFVDRAKERIRRRAENISAGDIEAAALAHPLVKEAAALGVPSGFEGDDDILLCLVMKPGFELDHVDFLRFLIGELPHFMVPRYLCRMAVLPRTATGKLQRAMLKDVMAQPDVWDRKRAEVALRDLTA